jgi:beta-lactamase regulating signal transducer with metallopeptidase domain/DNA-binding NarL/FixJ family response regulator
VNELHAIVAAVSWVLGDNHAGFPAAFAQFARAASPVAVDAMWQGAAVALGLLVSLRLAPRVNAAHRFAAWTAGFAVVAALPLLPFVAHLFWVPGAAVFWSSAAAAPVSVASGSRPWLELDSRWALGIAALWLIASALRLAEFIFHSFRLRKLWKTATPIAGAANATWLAALAGERGSVQICTTGELDRPSVIGFFSPRILIPDWLYARLTPQELSQVVMHEAEHLRRHDDWTNLIQKFFLVLFPLNPALAWMERRLCREREMACDESVVCRTQAPRAYAACLAGLAEHGLDRERSRRAEALSLAAWRRRPELVHRVHGILWRKPALSPVAARAMLAVLGCGLLAGSVELARCPQVVAFVAVSNSQELGPQQMAQADAVIRDRALYVPTNATAGSAQSFHMVQTKAILTPVRSEAMPASATPGHQNPVEPAENETAAVDATREHTPHETLLTAEMPDSGAQNASAAENAQPQPQYIVLTAWEQVQTAPQASREIADYDNGAPASTDPATQQAGAAADSHRKAAAAPQITVTRLIFRIVPASSAQGAKNESRNASGNASGSDSVNGSGTNSKSVQQPTVFPFGNGWLVFQL